MNNPLDSGAGAILVVDCHFKECPEWINQGLLIMHSRLFLESERGEVAHLHGAWVARLDGSDESGDESSEICQRILQHSASLILVRLESDILVYI